MTRCLRRDVFVRRLGGPNASLCADLSALAVLSAGRYISVHMIINMLMPVKSNIFTHIRVLSGAH
jgi:hypothetical protein